MRNRRYELMVYRSDSVNTSQLKITWYIAPACALNVVLLDQIDDHESFCLKINCGGNSFILYAVYKPPKSCSDFVKFF